MKRFIAVSLFVGVMGIAGDALPEGAKLTAPHTYSYTDAQGKKWIYRQTPFGLSKYSADDVQPAAETTDKNPPVATDLGDSVRFERKTPFGSNVWTKKKTELTPDEKALVAPESPEKK
ncbi:MAG TPA: hypothetical protein VKU01_17250 [Bryobacteraceae bacterium]|nr:hypothetical protein [Bryobacteraceae bacterium]